MRTNDDAGARAVRDRATKLADSGLFDGWRGIETALIGEGWPGAHEALSHEHVRLSLSERCANARQEHAAL